MLLGTSSMIDPEGSWRAGMGSLPSRHHGRRDLNAAKNLAALAAQVVAGSGPETQHARGGDVRPALTRADPNETGSRPQVHRGGTVAPQGTTA